MDYAAMAALAWRRLVIAPVVAAVTVVFLHYTLPERPTPLPTELATELADVTAYRDEMNRLIAANQPTQDLYWKARDGRERARGELDVLRARVRAAEAQPIPTWAKVMSAVIATFLLAAISVPVEMYSIRLLDQRSWETRKARFGGTQ